MMEMMEIMEMDEHDEDDGDNGYNKDYGDYETDCHSDLYHSIEQRGYLCFYINIENNVGFAESLI